MELSSAMDLSSEIVQGKGSGDLVTTTAMQFGVGAAVAAVVLWMLWNIIKTNQVAQSDREKWDREAREKMFSAIRGLTSSTEHNTAILQSMADRTGRMTDAIGRLPCSVTEDMETIPSREKRKTQVFARGIE